MDPKKHSLKFENKTFDVVNHRGEATIITEHYHRTSSSMELSFEMSKWLIEQLSHLPYEASEAHFKQSHNDNRLLSFKPKLEKGAPYASIKMKFLKSTMLSKFVCIPTGHKGLYWKKVAKTLSEVGEFGPYSISFKPVRATKSSMQHKIDSKVSLPTSIPDQPSSLRSPSFFPVRHSSGYFELVMSVSTKELDWAKATVDMAEILDFFEVPSFKLLAYNTGILRISSAQHVSRLLFAKKLSLLGHDATFQPTPNPVTEPPKWWLRKKHSVLVENLPEDFINLDAITCLQMLGM